MYRGASEQPNETVLTSNTFALFHRQFNLLGGGAKASHRGSQAAVDLPAGLPDGFNADVIPVHEAGSVRRLIHTQVGDGPQHLGADAHESLLQDDGTPKRLMRAKR